MLENTVKIVDAGDALIYEDGIPERGLSWIDLAKWYEQYEPEDTQNKLAARLISSLDSKPEKLFFRAYCDFIKKMGVIYRRLSHRFTCIMTLRQEVNDLGNLYLNIKEWILCS